LLDRDSLTGRLYTFFSRAGSPAEAGSKLALFLDAIREEAGLLQECGDDGYAFPHLTFQEYLAACHLANEPQMAELAYAHWQSADRERWREVLLLLMGRLDQQGKAEEKALPWLKQLWATKRDKALKDRAVARRDTVLAALSYGELQQRGALAASLLDLEEEAERPLRQAIVPLLATPDAQISPIDRITAATVLGTLGDPRYPVTIEAWQQELARRNERFGASPGYFCYVPGGSYRIGGWKHGEADATIDLQPFWVARFPITVAQYAPFVDEGYDADAERWWLPESWVWKQQNTRHAPVFWGQTGYNGANQPVAMFTWHEATAYCAWLTERLAADVPAGCVVRLPSEAEWETAACYDSSPARRSYPWGEQEPTLERAIYDAARLNAPAPVGCCPSGAAACGAFDLAGNSWELCASDYVGYPAGSHGLQKDFTDGFTPWRGGSWYQDETYIRCGTRVRYSINNFGHVGFRIVVAPPLAQ
jgi:formylglycine-generating enzyme required for sulfatase activity